MGFSDMQHLSGLQDYSTPSLSADGVWGSAGGIALTQSLKRGSASGVMDLLKSMDLRGITSALQEAGLPLTPETIGRGRDAVFASVQRQLDARKTANDHSEPVKPAFAAKAVAPSASPAVPKVNLKRDIPMDAAHVIQGLMGSGQVSVDVLGAATPGERGSLLLIAGQALKKGIQGFGFDGVAGKYQLPLSISMKDLLDLHQAAAVSVAQESARAGLGEWAAGDKLNELSEWVPDSVQRLLHGSVSLESARAVIQAIEGGGVGRHAGEIGTHGFTELLTAQGLDVNAPTVDEQAVKFGWLMKTPDRTRWQFFGPVVALDHRAGLVKITRTEVIELPFSALAEGQSKPKMGDLVRMGFKDGDLTVSVAARVGRESEGR